jgi:hypothetical protein
MKTIEGNPKGVFIHTRFDGVTEKGNKVSYTIPITKGNKVSIFGNLETIASVQEVDVYTGTQGDNIPNQIHNTSTEAGKYLAARLNYQIQRDSQDAKLWK